MKFIGYEDIVKRSLFVFCFVLLYGAITQFRCYGTEIGNKLKATSGSNPAHLLELRDA
jgi:hypothetical protein